MRMDARAATIKLAPIWIAAFCAAVFCLAGCGGTKQATASKQYPLTGKVVALDVKGHIATIDTAAIPNYMEAMKMDYPIASDADLASLKVGENITGTLKLASDGSYTLADIHEAGK